MKDYLKTIKNKEQDIYILVIKTHFVENLKMIKQMDLVYIVNKIQKFVVYGKTIYWLKKSIE